MTGVSAFWERSRALRARYRRMSPAFQDARILVWLTDGFPALSGLTPSGPHGTQLRKTSVTTSAETKLMEAVGIRSIRLMREGVVSVFDMCPDGSASRRQVDARSN